jgi:hypothetical protein
MKKLHWVIAATVLFTIIGFFAIREMTKEHYTLIPLNDNTYLEILKPKLYPNWKKAQTVSATFLNPITGKNDTVAMSKLSKDTFGFCGGRCCMTTATLDSTGKLAIIILDPSLFGKEPPQRPIAWAWSKKRILRIDHPEGVTCFFLKEDGEIYPEKK